MKKINELKKLMEGARSVRTFYYMYETDSWAIEYSFSDNRQNYVCAENLGDVRFYKTESMAIAQAKKLATKIDGEYTGRCWDLEFD